MFLLFGFIFSSLLPAQQKNYTNSIGMKFVYIPTGSFMMGTKRPICPKDDPYTEKNEYEECMKKVATSETPRHRVKISGFYCAKYETTQEQWYKVMGNNPSKHKSEKVGCNSRNHPVEYVSYNDVQEFIKKLNAREGINRYRLLSEAEWEYACRAGSNGKYCYGNSKNQLRQYAWYSYNSEKKTHKVGQKRPNAWGIYDMHGNVYEICEDLYLSDIYGKAYKYTINSSGNPVNMNHGNKGGAIGSWWRAVRGGCYYNDAEDQRCARRGCSLSSTYGRSDNTGFRLAMTSKSN